MSAPEPVLVKDKRTAEQAGEGVGAGVIDREGGGGAAVGHRAGAHAAVGQTGDRLGEAGQVERAASL